MSLLPGRKQPPQPVQRVQHGNQNVQNNYFGQL